MTCKKCGSEKEETKKKGYYRCRSCYNAYMREWLAKHPEAARRASNRASKWKRDNLAQANANERMSYAKRKERNPEAAYIRKRRDALRKYGISYEQYLAMLELQGGKCAICATTEPKGNGGKNGNFAVDHDHETGRVRALLCHRCNIGIGMLEGPIGDKLYRYFLECKNPKLRFVG